MCFYLYRLAYEASMEPNTRPGIGVMCTMSHLEGNHQTWIIILPQTPAIKPTIPTQHEYHRALFTYPYGSVKAS